VLALTLYPALSDAYLHELRTQLRYALARAEVESDVGSEEKARARKESVALEEQMMPQSLQELDALEAQLLSALEEVRTKKDQLGQDRTD